jgi:predicted nucleic acid-binding Zn ribbon protein
MIKGQDGMSLDNVDLTHAATLECEECKCKGFKQTLMLKKLSALVSPTGQEAIIPVAAFCCEQCGNINKQFLDADIKQV